MRVTNVERTRWGNYHDRTNSFDDTDDINAFIRIVKRNESLKEYIRSYVGKGNLQFVPHHFGKYSVDITLLRDGTPVADFDVERWSQWKDTWPEYYRHIHFLGRKEKFLQEERPFFMVYLNFPRNECLIVEKETIQQYPTITKTFKMKKVSDRVKEIPLSEGRRYK